MQPNKIGAIASYVLTVQFLLTLLWIVVSWPPTGLPELADSMAHYFRAHISEPLPFAVMNLYNVSFAVSALSLALILRRLFPPFTFPIDFAFFSIVIAAALYIASGVVPLVAAPSLAKAGNESGLSVLEGISAGLLLAGTMASGFGVAVFAWVGLRSRRLPVLFCCVMLLAGLIETAEWGVPAILVLDPLFGSVWSVWLGTLLWTNRVKV